MRRPIALRRLAAAALARTGDLVLVQAIEQRSSRNAEEVGGHRLVTVSPREGVQDARALLFGQLEAELVDQRAGGRVRSGDARWLVRMEGNGGNGRGLTRGHGRGRYPLGGRKASGCGVLIELQR